MDRDESNESDFESDLERCPVCLDFQTCDSIIMECCDKLIHSDCLSTWLRTRNNCPLCRTQQSNYYNDFRNIPPIREPDVDFLNFFNLGVSRNQNSIGISGFNNTEELFSNFLYPRARSGIGMRPRRRRMGFSFPSSEYLPFLNNLGITQGIVDEIYNDIENGITMYQEENIIGVSYSSIMSDVTGITSFNVENDDNQNLNIRVNGDLNINFNIRDLTDSVNYLQTLTNLLNDIHNVTSSNNNDDEMEEVD